MNVNEAKEKLVFGLDIGTRSVVGTVGYLKRDRFVVVCQRVKEHETRAMIDGQIHDIKRVDIDSILDYQPCNQAAADPDNPDTNLYAYLTDTSSHLVSVKVGEENFTYRLVEDK